MYTLDRYRKNKWDWISAIHCSLYIHTIVKQVHIIALRIKWITLTDRIFKFLSKTTRSYSLVTLISLGSRFSL